MSKTPRTDHFMREQEAKEYPPPPYPIFDFARELESENAELREALKDCVEALHRAETRLYVRINPPTLESARALLAKVEAE